MSAKGAISPAFVQQHAKTFFGGTLARQLAKFSRLSPSSLISTFESPQRMTLGDVQQSSMQSLCLRSTLQHVACMKLLHDGL